MKATRRQREGTFKAKVGLDPISGIKPVAQTARGYESDPAQVTQWNAVIRERLPELFDRGSRLEDPREPGLPKGAKLRGLGLESDVSLARLPDSTPVQAQGGLLPCRPMRAFWAAPCQPERLLLVGFRPVR